MWGRFSVCALVMMTGCASDPGGADESNPFVAGATTNQWTSDTKSVTALRAEAAKFAANLLSAAGITGFQIIDKPPAKSSYHAAWVAPGLLGRLLIHRTVSAIEAVHIITTVSAKKCKGKFATVKLPLAASSGAAVKTVCVDPSGKARAITFVALPRRKGGNYLIALVALEGGLASGEAGARSSSDVMVDKLMNVDLKVVE